MTPKNDGSELLERAQLAKNLNEAIEQITELDEVSDAVWELRGQVLEGLKKIGYIPQDATGPDYQDLIHRTIVKLVELTA